MITLVLMRHGDTSWSADARMTGRTDVPLSDRGRQKALNAGRALCEVRFDRFVCSPLSRALDTATLLTEAHGALGQPAVSDALIEVDYGLFEGHSAASAESAGIGEAFRRWRALDGGPVAPCGEDLAGAADRARDLLYQHAQGTTLAVAHGTLLRCFASEMLGMGASRYRRLQLDPCNALIMRGDPAHARLVAANVPPESIPALLAEAPAR